MKGLIKNYLFQEMDSIFLQISLGVLEVLVIVLESLLLEANATKGMFLLTQLWEDAPEKQAPSL